jgi:hypothetical protein
MASLSVSGGVHESYPRTKECSSEKFRSVGLGRTSPIDRRRRLAGSLALLCYLFPGRWSLEPVSPMYQGNKLLRSG